METQWCGSELPGPSNCISNVYAVCIDRDSQRERFNASKNTDAPYIRTLEKMFDMESKIMMEMNLLLELKEQIREVIGQVDKPEQQMILRCRYIHNMSWPKIGEELCADTVTVQRWHNKAIAKIELPEDAINLKK